MDAVGGIELAETGTPSYILRDLSEYAILAFIASFDVPEVANQRTKLATTTTTTTPTSQQQQQKRITYIALAKICMPKLADLFLQFKDKDDVFVDEIVEAVLSAYAVPIKLKYECPLPSKFGKDPPLWKTATSCFLKIVKEVGPRISALDSSERQIIYHHSRCGADASWGRVVACANREYMETGDGRLPWWNPGRLVRLRCLSLQSLVERMKPL
jgi:hypothetical protein